MPNNLRIKQQSLAARCDICHQSDCFDPETNRCSRCESAGQSRDPIRPQDTDEIRAELNQLNRDLNEATERLQRQHSNNFFDLDRAISHLGEQLIPQNDTSLPPLENDHIPSILPPIEDSKEQVPPITEPPPPIFMDKLLDKTEAFFTKNYQTVTIVCLIILIALFQLVIQMANYFKIK